MQARNYTIVTAMRSETKSDDDMICELERSVYELIKKNWKPLGGIAVIPETNQQRLSLYQALILE